jgi:hypothetical protein
VGWPPSSSFGVGVIESPARWTPTQRPGGPRLSRLFIRAGRQTRVGIWLGRCRVLVRGGRGHRPPAAFLVSGVLAEADYPISAESDYGVNLTGYIDANLVPPGVGNLWRRLCPPAAEVFVPELSLGKVTLPGSRASLQGTRGGCRDRTFTGWSTAVTGCTQES